MPRSSSIKNVNGFKKSTPPHQGFFVSQLDWNKTDKTKNPGMILIFSKLCAFIYGQNFLLLFSISILIQLLNIMRIQLLIQVCVLCCTRPIFNRISICNASSPKYKMMMITMMRVSFAYACTPSQIWNRNPFAMQSNICDACKVDDDPNFTFYLMCEHKTGNLRPFVIITQHRIECIGRLLSIDHSFYFISFPTIHSTIHPNQSDQFTLPQFWERSSYEFSLWRSVLHHQLLSCTFFTFCTS